LTYWDRKAAAKLADANDPVATKVQTEAPELLFVERYIRCQGTTVRAVDTGSANVASQSTTERGFAKSRAAALEALPRLRALDAMLPA